MSDARILEDPAARVALNARIAPELRRRLQLAVRERSSTVQDVVEAQLTDLLNGIDIAGIRAGTATAPGRATNPRGAETVPLNVRIRVPLAARIDALVVAVAGTTRQGLVIEALEALEEPGTTPEDLWSVIAGTAGPAAGKPAARKTTSKTASKTAKTATPVKKAAGSTGERKNAAPRKATSKEPAKKAVPAEAASPAETPAVAAEPTTKPRRQLTAIGMLN